MTPENIYAMLSLFPSWVNAEPHVWSTFCREMAECQYGYDALREAWAWFHKGYVQGGDF